MCRYLDEVRAEETVKRALVLGEVEGEVKKVLKCLRGQLVEGSGEENELDIQTVRPSERQV